MSNSSPFQSGLSFGMPMPSEGGLWNPALEHDACGIGFVADVKGRQSHEIVQRGIEAVCRLTHRGAVASDSKTGDGAGIITQIPREMFIEGLGRGQRKIMKRQENLAVAMIFFPTHDDARHRCYRICEAAIGDSELVFLEWRRVPLDRDALGESGRETCPAIRQLLLARLDEMSDQEFDRACYVLRKDIERRVAAEGIEGFYIPSLSRETIIYKGLVVAPQLPKFYLDLEDKRYVSSLALYHQRYSTNTFPTWFLAQPFRFLAHNGEINTLQGNVNWMRARELAEDACIWGSQEAMAQLRPIVQPRGSDSAALDNCLESIVLGGRDLLHAVLMMVPEAYATDSGMDDNLRAFYEYHACLQEPWDGPAALSFTDGRVIGAMLDRNGLRPQRYQISDDGLLVVGSEVGVVDLKGAKVLEKGRLGPGQIIALDTQTGELMRNHDIKERYASRAPYRQWVDANLVKGDDIALPQAAEAQHPDVAFVNGVPLEAIALMEQQKAFGYTEEDVDDMVRPMVKTGNEAIYSMGDDTPLAVLSEKPRPLYAYFRQRFAQVTNPPIDPLREKLVMSLTTQLGPNYNLWDEDATDCRKIQFASPLLTQEQIGWLRGAAAELNEPKFKTATLSAIWPVLDGEVGLEMALNTLRRAATRAVREGATILILSDKGVDARHAPIPALLAVGAVHHHLIREGLRTRASLVSETGDARDSHHFACLISYGANAVYPYLAYETAASICRQQAEPIPIEKGIASVRKAAESGLLKIMSKMGISTLASYGGAQIFEALGLAPAFVEDNFTHTPSRIKGASYEEIARDVLRHHMTAFPPETSGLKLENFAFLRYRKGGEEHAFNPTWFKKVHDSVRKADGDSFRVFAQMVNHRENPIALRDLLEYKTEQEPISIDDVEPASAIFPRLATGAMSHGALSSEAHECLAIAMNRLGGRSNSGEGGEEPDRFRRDENGDWRNSAIKQVASGRFGVTPEYLASSKELQIKMAQGAKPGEGGQLPGFKVNEEIARVRHSVPGVTLISPPPHHDIYSIEDLAQLIYDLKMVNPRARVSVKLVAQAGVGTVAAGVAKAYADTIVISGHDGGTGASPVVSIKNTGVSWELGLAEAQQVLIQNGLRGRVRLHADGGFKTGRDVIMAALLGAEEYGFGSAALVAAGCVMARQCHLNTCPVGVATQNNELRAKFPGDPEHVVNYFKFVAQEIREHLALMGFRRLEDIIGRSDLLQVKADMKYPKTPNVDLSPLFFQFEKKENNPHRCVVGKNDRPADWPLDETMLQDARDAIAEKRYLELAYPIENINRSVGARLAGQIAYMYGEKGLPDNTLTIRFVGSAGQSFGAFTTRGMRLELLGEACDYVGKGMHGGTIMVRPTGNDPYVWHENTLIGNTVLYGATGGTLFAAGCAGERFGVRNSGATAVVEGIGDHGCEYMTGGTIVVLGEAGRNFGAGMSGGVAYLYDPADTLPQKFNPDMVGLERVQQEEDKATLRELMAQHHEATTSPRAAQLLSDFESEITNFYKVVPHPEKAPAPVKEDERKERAARSVERRERPARVAANGNGQTHSAEQITAEQQATAAAALPAAEESPKIGSEI